jgi:cytidylate kinase
MRDVICISSEDGAGALAAAGLVARELDFRLIDEDIVTRAATEAGVDRAVMADVERRKSVFERLLDEIGKSGMSSGYGFATGMTDLPGGPASDEMRGLIRSVIEETAQEGRTIMVSHAASLALGDQEGVLRVFVTASPQTRASRMAATQDIDEKDAERALKRSDANRADYIKRFYGVQELPTHYDLVINTDRLTPEEASRLILAAAGSQTGG